VDIQISDCGKRVVDINTLAIIGGSLPPRATGLAIEWATQHRTELQEVWEQARKMAPLDSIDPLP